MTDATPQNRIQERDETKTGASAMMTPLTDGQESLYILSWLGNNLPTYNMPFAFRMRGPVHLRAFMDALRQIIARHHALRSNIVETEIGLRQSLRESTEPVFEFHDLSKTDP